MILIKNKVFLGVLIGVVTLVSTALTEYLFYQQEKGTWVVRLEEKLHKAEEKADEYLGLIKDSVDIDSRIWNEDIIYVGFREGKIFFWSDARIGCDDLYDVLNRGTDFVRINNTYYDVRKRKVGDTEYFALLHIKNDYPYSNKYVQNKFSKFLHISDENAGHVKVLPDGNGDGISIKNKDGRKLFTIVYDNSYKERAPNYLLLLFYLVFFISLFYVYNELERGASSWKFQLLYMFLFIVCLAVVRYVVVNYQLPPSLYRLPVFDTERAKDIYINSIGDFLLTALCIFFVCYITLVNLKIDYQSGALRRYRYLVGAAFIFLTFMYIEMFNFAIGLVIENMDIHLNIARLIHIGLPSLIAFVAIIICGLVIVMIIYSSVTVFQSLLSFSSVVKTVTVACLLLCFLSYSLKLYTNFWDCFFIWVIYLLIAVNKYLVKRDVQRSIYILVVFLLSIYIVMIMKKYERYKELTQRPDFATELIEERDYNFEGVLVDISEGISGAPLLAELIEEGEELVIDSILLGKLLNISGYNYRTEINLCHPTDSLFLVDEKRMYNCRDFFESQIRRYGAKVGHTHFYAIDDFDGLVSYVGRFRFGEMILYIRFDAAKGDEGEGYPRVLSRKSMGDKKTAYHYSYAKYKNGELITSSGDFIYFKRLSALGELGDNIEIVNKDNYSHMLIPVEGNNALVISLPINTFSFYYMNVLYAFFTCIIISSYGLFFNVNRNINFRKGTLKARIKNNVISLIFVLFVILTALSIYLNTSSFEARHNNKAREFLKYINKELERQGCVDVRKCPEIVEFLSAMSELLMIDINIYSEQGNLTATSRPEIFKNGFEGNLVNPKALKQIVANREMSYITQEKVGELSYLSAYMPLVLDNGQSYILNVPYFTQNDELNLDIFITVVITVNIAIVMMVLAFILSGVLAERVTKPLQMVNDKLRRLRFGGKNEKIAYDNKDEVGILVQEYNNMVDKLDESIALLARSERENAWREMARQIAHEIKNPLTPMKLNIQYMQRFLQIEDPEELKKRFRDTSSMLIEQIDNMASIASAFSDFAKMPVANCETFDISDLVASCAALFKNNIDNLETVIESDIRVFADKEQMRRVFINILKNAEQAIPGNRKGLIWIGVCRDKEKVEIRIRDNGCGIPSELKERIFEPNFTTKSSGTGLGLAISRRIIESMDGTIDFSSIKDIGTEFVIVLDCVKNV